MKILVVDDEELIRKGLVKTIGRISSLIAEIKEATNGQDAFTILKTFQPDVVLTDIKMPVMDGLELIAKANQTGLRTHFIIISGFEEFSYARTAMKYGVTSYLLKPIDEDELLELISKINAQLQRAHTGTQQASSHKHKVSQLKNAINDFSHQLEDAQSGKEPVQLPYSDFYVAVSYLYDVAIHHNESASIDKIFEIFHSVKLANEAAYGLYVFENHAAELVCILSGEGLSPAAVQKYLRQVVYEVRQSAHLELRLGVSNRMTDSRELRTAYLQGADAMLQQIYTSRERIFGVGQDAPSGLMPPETWEQCKTAVINALLNLDKSTMITSLTLLFSQVEKHHPAPTALLHALKKLLTHVFGEVGSLHTSFDLSSERYTRRLELMFRTSTLEEIQAKYTLFFVDLFHLLLSSQEDNSRKIIQVAKSYIQNNCFSKITLALIAGKLQMSPAYLSHLFKKETGYNFVDYVTEVKMHKAKELLLASPDLKIYEIADKLGYNDVKYFNRVYKKLFAETPGDCRRSQSKGK